MMQRVLQFFRNPSIKAFSCGSGLHGNSLVQLRLKTNIKAPGIRFFRFFSFLCAKLKIILNGVLKGLL